MSGPEAALAIDPDAGFDQPAELPGSTVDPFSYHRAVAHLREYHTGDRNKLLTIEQEQELAIVIQQSNDVRASLEELQAKDQAAYLIKKEQQDDLLAEGDRAVLKLFESNLRISIYLARASMGLITPPDNRRLGAFTDIRSLRSIYADEEDRVQVANIGLLKAARTFKPVVGRDGKPVSFFTHALWKIHSELSRHVKVHENPGWYTGHELTDAINRARGGQEESLDAEPRAQLIQADEGRNTVFMEDITFADTAVDDEEEPEEVLGIADVLQDDTVTVEYDALTSSFVSKVESVLWEMATVPKRKKESEQSWTIRVDQARRNVEVLRLRLGISVSNGREYYGRPLTLEEIGRAVGLTRERVRQIESKGMVRLRLMLYKRALELPDDDSMDFSDYYTPPTAESFSQLRTRRVIAHKALEPTVSTLDQPDFMDTRGAPRESWQAYPGEPFDIQDIETERQQAYEEVAEAFTQMLLHLNPYSFQESFARTLATSYPVTVVDAINEQFGNSLTANHIEEFWNTHFEQFVDALSGKVDDLSLDRVSTLFAKLLAERMDDASSITLNIAEEFADSLNFIGSWLEHGQLYINGNAGNFVGYKMGGLAEIHVYGSAGNFAGTSAHHYSSLEVDGDAGDFCGGEARQAARIKIHGSVGAYCGAGINGEDVVISVDGNAGEEVAVDAHSGTVLIGGNAASISSEHGDVRFTVQ